MAFSAAESGDATTTSEVMRMGGLFSAPKPTVAATPAPPPTPAASATSPAVELAGQEARVEARARAGRGRTGTIATSARGVLEPLPGLARKSLLGE